MLWLEAGGGGLWVFAMFCEWPPFTPSPPSVDIWQSIMSDGVNWKLMSFRINTQSALDLYKMLLKTSLLSLTVADKKSGSRLCYIQPCLTETNPANLYLGSRSYKLVPDKVIVDNTQKTTLVMGCKPTHRQSFNFFCASDTQRSMVGSWE